MSRRRRSRTSQRSSQVSSPICASEASIKAPEAAPTPLICIAQSEDDVVAIHRFMIAHAIAEMAEEDVDTLIYMQTIYDTVTNGAGLIAVLDAQMVGYLGLWKSRYDYSKAEFMHDRGFYVLPTHRDG